MRNRSRSLVLALVLAASATPLGAQSRSETLVVGEQKTFKPGYAVGDIAISNPAVCDFRVVSGRREIMLIANGPGFTMLTVWDQRGVKRDEISIEVLSVQFAKLLKDLEELLAPYPDVRVKPLGTTAVLTGTVDTREDLEAVRALANASRVTSTVTLRPAAAGTGTTGTATPAVQTPPRTSPAPASPAVPSVVRDPDPPPPVRRAPVVVPAPTPVPVGATTPPPAAVPVPVRPEPEAAPAPVAIPAPAAPTPNISPTAPAATPVPAPAPPAPTVTVPSPPPAPAGAAVSEPAAVPSPAGAAAPVASGWGTPVGTGAVEYILELYESPAGGPPPEVAGPQGRRLYIGRLRSDPGLEVRSLIKVSLGQAGERSFSIGLTPTVTSGAIQTSVVVDTDLPLGTVDPKRPTGWMRSTLTFASRPGQSKFIREDELARGGRSGRSTVLLVVITPSLIRAPGPDAPDGSAPGGDEHASWR